MIQSRRIEESKKMKKREKEENEENLEIGGDWKKKSKKSVRDVCKR